MSSRDEARVVGSHLRARAAIRTSRDGRWAELLCAFPVDVLDLWEVAASRLEREGLILRPDLPAKIHHGQILEMLLAEYLASPEQPAGQRSDRDDV